MARLWDRRRLQLLNRYPASTYPVPIHDDDALRNIGRCQCPQDVAHARGYIGLAPVTVAEQDKARVGDACEREEARIVEIGGDDRPRLLFRTGHDVDVGGVVE